MHHGVSDGVPHAVQVNVEGHDDEVRSRGSSASSSPRYSSAVLSHLAASMAASNRNAMQSPVGTRGLPRSAAGSQQYGAAGHQQSVYGFGTPHHQQQQQQYGRVSHLGAVQDGSRMMAGSPAYLPAPHASQGYASLQRPMAVAAEGYGGGWSHQGARIAERCWLHNHPRVALHLSTPSWTSGMSVVPCDYCAISTRLCRGRVRLT